MPWKINEIILDPMVALCPQASQFPLPLWERVRERGIAVRQIGK